jgi:hypothetical protein
MVGELFYVQNKAICKIKEDILNIPYKMKPNIWPLLKFTPFFTYYSAFMISTYHYILINLLLLSYNQNEMNA